MLGEPKHQQINFFAVIGVRRWSRVHEYRIGPHKARNFEEA